jgi:hypothetical protein
MCHDQDAPRLLKRREALTLLGGLGASALVIGCGESGTADGASDTTSASADAGATSCILSPEVTEGPYWIVGTPTRRNITEGKPGVPLILDLSLDPPFR